MSKSLGNVVEPQEVIKNSGADILRLWVAASDYSDDQRIGPEILKSFAEAYRKTPQHAPLDAGHTDAPRREARRSPTPICRSSRSCMLNELAEIDPIIRKAYAEYDYKKVVATLAQFMNTELSAFYFDIRKDALYCEAPSSSKRLRRARHGRADLPLRHRLAGADPGLHRRGSLALRATAMARATRSTCSVPGHSRGLAQRRARREVGRRSAACAAVVTGALELERAAKRIGSSLEAAPIVYVADAGLRDLLGSIDLAEVCITSGITITGRRSAGRCIRGRRHLGRGRRAGAGGRQEVRPLVADHQRRRQRRGLPRAVGPRRRRHARDRREIGRGLRKLTCRCSCTTL